MTEKEKKEICDKCDVSYVCDHKSMPDCSDIQEKEIKSKEDCEWFGIKTIQKPCGQCDKNCRYKNNKPQKDCQKEIEEMARVISDMEIPNAHYYVEENGRTVQLEAFANSIDIAKALYNTGYGKVSDYKKEIFALKTTLEDRKHEVRELNKKVEKFRLEQSFNNYAFMTSPIGDLPINKEGLWKAVDEIVRLQRVEVELQELNMKYYNEAKDSKRKIARLIQDLKTSRNYVATDIDGRIIDYATTSDDKVYPIKEYINLVKQQEIKEFAKRLKDKFNGYEATSYNGCEEGWHDLQEEIDGLLKEYGVEL